MSTYVVNWDRTDGDPGWHPVADVQEATSYVERLRNVDGVESTRIYRLDEVAFEFRPYFRVELAKPATSFAASIAADPQPVDDLEPLGEVVASPTWATDAPADDDAVNGTRRGLFGR